MAGIKVVSVYVNEHFLTKKMNQRELQLLVDEFKKYKENLSFKLLGISSSFEYFGKDELLTQPPEVRNILYKVHLKPISSPKSEIKKWVSSIIQGRIPTSDRVLIYTKGAIDESNYLLLDLLEPNGHEKMKNFNHVRYLKDLADIFREQH